MPSSEVDLRARHIDQWVTVRPAGHVEGDRFPLPNARRLFLRRIAGVSPSVVEPGRVDDGWYMQIFNESHPGFPLTTKRGGLWIPVTGASGEGSVVTDGFSLQISSHDVFAEVDLAGNSADDYRYDEDDPLYLSTNSYNSLSQFHSPSMIAVSNRDSGWDAGIGCSYVDFPFMQKIVQGIVGNCPYEIYDRWITFECAGASVAGISPYSAEGRIAHWPAGTNEAENGFPEYRTLGGVDEPSVVASRTAFSSFISPVEASTGPALGSFPAPPGGASTTLTCDLDPILSVLPSGGPEQGLLLGIGVVQVSAKSSPDDPDRPIASASASWVAGMSVKF